MKSFLATIVTSSLFPILASADKKMGETGKMTNIAEAEWIGIVAAIFIIAATIIFARIIRKN